METRWPQFVLLLLTLLCGWCSRTGTDMQIRAEEDLKPRRLYVPEEFPLEWPRGDWRPITKSRLLQLQGSSESTGLERKPPPLKDATYECRFEAGGELTGTFQAELQRRPNVSEWVDLGRTNLSLQSARISDAPADWGTALDGRCFLLQTPEVEHLNANWKMSGVSAGLGYRFQIHLFQAVHSRFVVTLPSRMTLNITEPANPAVFRRQISPELQEWTIHGLERSRLAFTVETATTPGSQRKTLARQVHLLTIAPAEQSFTSDFKLEYLPADAATAEILLPGGFQPDSVQFQQETLGTWSLRPFSEESSDQILTIRWQRGSSTRTGTIRVRGQIQHFRRMSLETRLPRLLDTLDLETQVNLSVHAPYVLKSCLATGLEQIDTRLTANVRDIWTYEATVGNPSLQLEVALPQPELTIDQLMVVAAGATELDVQHLMLWTSSRDQQFGTSFQVAPGFEVRNVAVLSETPMPPQLSWTTLRQQNRDMLTIQLANQLVPGQPLPVVVSLRAKLDSERKGAYSLPVLTPITARIQHSYLVQQGVLLVNPPLPERDLPVMTAEEARPWSVLNKLADSQSSYEWQTDWIAKNLAGMTRIRVRPQPITEVSADDASRQKRARTVVLRTQLLCEGERILVKYRVEVPDALRRDRNSLNVSFSEQRHTLSWKEVRSGSSASHSSTATPTAPLVSKQVDREGISSHVFQWSNPIDDPPQTLIWESYWQPASHFKERFPISLPTLSPDLPFQGYVQWNPGEFTLAETLSGTAETLFVDGESVLAYNSLEQVRELVAIRKKQDPTTNAPPGQESPWNCHVAVAMHPGKQIPTRVVVAYQAPPGKTVLKEAAIRFSQPVWLRTAGINDWQVQVHQWTTEYRYPLTSEPIQTLTLEYDCGENTTAVLPIPDFAAQRPRLQVCLPGQIRPEPGRDVLFWNQLPRTDWNADLASFPTLALSTPDNSAVPPGNQNGAPSNSTLVEVSEQTTAAHAGLRLLQSPHFQELLWKQGYVAHEGQPRSTTGEVFEVRWREETSLSSWTVWMFLATMLMCLSWLTFGKPSRLVLGIISVVALLGVVLLDRSPFLPLITACAAALLLIVIFLDFWKSCVERLRPVPAGEAPASSAAFSTVMFRGTALLWVAVLAGDCVSPGYGQVASDLNPPVKQMHDMLIPVEAARLRDQFRGLTPDEYPEVLYITPELAQKLNERAAVDRSQRLLLFESADYTARWTEQNQLIVRCDYRILDTAVTENRGRLILPLKNIAALTTLQAMVNGQPATMIPLPDGTGLEIPLENPLGEQTPDASQPGPFRRYRIELEVIAGQESTPRGTRARLSIPPVINSHCTLGFPANTECDLELGGMEQIPLRRQPASPTVTFSLSESSQLSLLFRPVRSSQDADLRNPELQADLLCSVLRNFLEVKMHVSILFTPESERNLTWRLPAGMILRSWYAPDAMGTTLNEAADNQTNLTLRFAEGGPSRTTAVLTLVAPLPTRDAEMNLLLPQLIKPKLSAEEDLKWQIGLQTNLQAEMSSIEFPETPSSRISRETFMASWPDAEAVQSDVQCFRVRNPRRLKALWQEGTSRFNVEAQHDFTVGDQAVEVTSQYRGTSQGKPFWSLSFAHSNRWAITGVQAVVDGQDIPTRNLFHQDELELVLGARCAKSFDVRIQWQQTGNPLVAGRDVTPPRIRGAGPYREIIRQLPGTRQGWLICHPLSPPDSSPPPAGWSSESPLVLEGGMQEDLGLLRIEPLPVDRDLAPVPPADTFPASRSETEAVGKGEEQPPATNVPLLSDWSTTAESPGGIQVDHSLWKDQEMVFGETLVYWSKSSSRSGDQVVRIELPENLEVLERGHSAAVEVQRSPMGLIVRERPGNHWNDFSSRFLVFRWQAKLPFGWGIRQMFQVPTVQQTVQTTWRLLALQADGEHISELPEVAMASWRKYLEHLQNLGRFGESANGPNSTGMEVSMESPFVQPGEVTNAWPEANRLFYRSLSEVQQKQIRQGYERVHALVWTKPSPLYFSRVRAAGIETGSQARIGIQNTSVIFRIALALLIAIWGITLWRNERGPTRAGNWSLATSCALLLLALSLRVMN